MYSHKVLCMYKSFKVNIFQNNLHKITKYRLHLPNKNSQILKTVFNLRTYYNKNFKTKGQKH